MDTKMYTEDDVKRAIWVGFALGFIIAVGLCFVIGYINVTNA